MNINDKIAENLKIVIDMYDEPLTTICNNAGVHQPSIFKFLARTQDKIKIEDLVKLAEYLNVPVENFWTKGYVAGATEPDANLISVEYFDSVRVSAGFGIENFNEKPDGHDMLPARFFKHIKNMENIKCLRVCGNSMLPAFDDGDYIFVDISIKTITPEQGIYVISIDGELYVKGVQKIPGGIQLLSYNKNYEPIIVTADKYNPESVVAIGKVVAAFTLKDYY